MKPLEERLMEARNAVGFLVDELTHAWNQARKIERPEGATAADKALTLYLAERTAEARALQSKLYQLL